MGIHRINEFFVEEFGSPGDLRFRIETDIRIPRTPEDRGFLRSLRNAVESSRHEAVRDLLLARLEPPEKAPRGHKRKGVPPDPSFRTPYRRAPTSVTSISRWPISTVRSDSTTECSGSR